MEQDYQKRIEQNQRFLLKLVNLHIFNYYPLRRYLGITIGNKKIDEISHLSWAYDTKYFKKGKKWFKQQTRTYQQPDLGYKLNLLLDKIPQLSLLPALLQPAYGLGALAFFFLTQTTYQPSTADGYIYEGSADSNYGDATLLWTKTQTGYAAKSIIHFDITDIPNGATFSQGDLLLYCTDGNFSTGIIIYRLLALGWTEAGATWNKYDGTNYWNTAGASGEGEDFVTTNAVTKTLNGSKQWHTWNAAALIQDCFDEQSKNVYLLLKESTGISGRNSYQASREYTDNTSLRPKLTVTYTAPVDNAILFSCNF